MKKILSLLAALGIGATGTSGVISCSNNNTNSSNSDDSNNNVEETDLAKLITVTNMTFTDDGTDEPLINEIINQNNNTNFTENDITFPDYPKVDENNVVKTTVLPAEGSKYTGSVDITITIIVVDVA